jgi:hypothetical protein
VKALTVCQPHAWAIIHGDKRVENRTWPSNHRGLLLIHSGKSRERLRCTRYPGQPPDSELAFGALIGLVFMYGCGRPEQFTSPYAEGPWCHAFSEVVPLAEPVPWRGTLGYFDVPLDAFWSALPSPYCIPEPIWAALTAPDPAKLKAGGVNAND